MKVHRYQSKIEWTGNNGSGTDHYKNYERDHDIIITGKPIISGSSDPAFRGDKGKHNPEDLLVSSLSSCHMLWYLHFCSNNGVIVEEYWDTAEGKMIEQKDGKGNFKEVILSPRVRVRKQEMADLAIELHKKASEYCFIANSVNFPVLVQPTVSIKKMN
ncbi:OsmC family protein [Sphingobacterium yanglingense]|uniref:Organic hydroperoxide reductase OsmC/OhrA n=1 Tax=Sphingobacterium yanglingense TaxID=1437280 RepID=A0A4R6WIS7_9SPHI|nr:OsmC family protein [Sphingobacterium yanglingense]TDQ78261.1 organic hydroperoxide reductase OsmC/OhrA [Sphingobacterium yanglingense]